MRRILAAIVVSLLALGLANAVSASVKLEGWLIVEEACIATKSLRGSSGDWLEPGRAYPLLGKNRADNASHYRIRLGASGSSDRWVGIDCGIHVVRADPASSETGVTTTDDKDDKEGRKPVVRNVPLLLAVSWQPAFCEARSRQRECKSQHQGRFDATHFSLHGLWPQPRENVYCGVSARDKRNDKDRRWDWLPVLDLEAATRSELNRVMPGTASFLHRHEWIKHGTCYPEGAERYYRDSLRAMNQLNSSEVRALFAANVGQNVTTKAIRQAFDNAFGRGAGQRVQVSCKNDGRRRLITELKIHLAGPLDDDSSLADVIRAGAKTAPGCNGGIVDPVGLQ